MRKYLIYLIFVLFLTVVYMKPPEHIFVLFVLLLFLAVGCMKQPEHILKQQEEIVKLKEENFVLSLLPSNSVIVETLGSDWYVVEIIIDKQPRKFLLKWWFGSHGETGLNLTELSEDE